MSDDKKEMSVEEFITWFEKYHNIKLYEFQKKMLQIMWENKDRELYYLIPRRGNFTFRSNIIFIK